MSRLISASQKYAPLKWNADQGYWILEVPVAVPWTSRVILALQERFLPVQKQRYAALPPGDHKDDLKKAIVALVQGRIMQRVVGYHGDSKGDIVALGGGIRG